MNPSLAFARQRGLTLFAAKFSLRETSNFACEVRYGFIAHLEYILFMTIGHKKQWEFLKNKSALSQLSHAYLFTGAEGIGKKTFAIEFSEFLGCKFPDLKIISLKEDKKEIDISQVREIQSFLAYKSYNGGYKIVIIDGAHLMNVEAQNCLLKTLEEPKGETLIILTSSKPDVLLPTIFSRCQTIKFFKNKDSKDSADKVDREKEILEKILPVLNSTYANKFKYVKDIDFDKEDASEIVQVLQRYLRNQLLERLEKEDIGGLKKKHSTDKNQE